MRRCDNFIEPLSRTSPFGAPSVTIWRVMLSRLVAVVKRVCGSTSGRLKTRLGTCPADFREDISAIVGKCRLSPLKEGEAHLRLRGDQR